MSRNPAVSKTGEIDPELFAALLEEFGDRRQLLPLLTADEFVRKVAPREQLSRAQTRWLLAAIQDEIAVANALHEQKRIVFGLEQPAPTVPTRRGR